MDEALTLPITGASACHPKAYFAPFDQIVRRALERHAAPPGCGHGSPSASPGHGSVHVGLGQVQLGHLGTHRVPTLNAHRGGSTMRPFDTSTSKYPLAPPPG